MHRITDCRFIFSGSGGPVGSETTWSLSVVPRVFLALLSTVDWGNHSIGSNQNTTHTHAHKLAATAIAKFNPSKSAGTPTTAGMTRKESAPPSGLPAVMSAIEIALDPSAGIISFAILVGALRKKGWASPATAWPIYMMAIFVLIMEVEGVNVAKYRSQVPAIWKRAPMANWEYSRWKGEFNFLLCHPSPVLSILTLYFQPLTSRVHADKKPPGMYMRI